MSIAEELKAKAEPKKQVWTPPATPGPQPAAAPADVEKPQVLEGPKGHTATIKKLTDASQKFPYVADCTCQFQGRAKTEVDIKTTVQRHFERHE